MMAGGGCRMLVRPERSNLRMAEVIHARHDLAAGTTGGTPTERQRADSPAVAPPAVAPPGGTSTERQRATGQAPQVDAGWVADATVDEVAAHLDANPGDHWRVLALEHAGKGRTSITDRPAPGTRTAAATEHPTVHGVAPDHPTAADPDGS